MAAGNREHPRPRHVAVAVRDTHAVAIVRNVPAEHRGKTELPFDLAQDQHATIRGQLSAINRCRDCFSADRGQAGQKQRSVSHAEWCFLLVTYDLVATTE